MTEDKTNREIVAALNVSEGTIKFRDHGIFKNGVSKRAQVVVRMLKSGHVHLHAI